MFDNIITNDILTMDLLPTTLQDNPKVRQKQSTRIHNPALDNFFNRKGSGYAINEKYASLVMGECALDMALKGTPLNNPIMVVMNCRGYVGIYYKSKASTYLSIRTKTPEDVKHIVLPTITIDKINKIIIIDGISYIAKLIKSKSCLYTQDIRQYSEIYDLEKL